MNLREYCKTNRISITQISHDTGIPYSTVNDIINGRIELNRVSYGHVKRIAGALDLTLSQMEKLSCTIEDGTGKESTQEETDMSRPWKIIIRNKSYYMQTGFDADAKAERLCKVTPLNTEFVQYMAERRWKEAERMKRLEAVWN